MDTLLEPTTRVRLANGMEVLGRRLRHAPVVCSMVWYGVGSRNESPGQTGISHFLEHMMFKGTPRFPYGALEEGIKARGGMWNAFTSYDYTAYYEALPARHLEYGLEVEADRMVNMTFDPDLTVRERGIILSERAGRENNPYFWLFEAFMQEAYHLFPYRHPVLGYEEDIRAVTAEALAAHYRRYYRPNNATLVVVGDVEPDRLVALAEKHFGSIPAGAPVDPLTVREPEQDAARRVVVRRPGPNPYFLMGYKIPEAGHPDRPALTLLAAVLSGGGASGLGSAGGMGRSNRLYRRLINTGLAVSAAASLLSLQYPGLFLLSAIPGWGVSLSQVEEAVIAEVERLQTEPVSEEELDRTKKQMRAQLLYGMEGAMGQATLLGSMARTQGLYSFDQVLRMYAAVSPEDLRRVARTYLRPERCTVGWFEPCDSQPEQAVFGAPGASKRFGQGTSASNKEAPRGTTPPYQQPQASAAAVLVPDQTSTPDPIIRPEAVQRTPLPGGATLLVYPVAALPSVHVRVQMEAGAVFDPPGKEGLAQLTAQVAARATRSLPAEELALRTDALGMSLRLAAGRETAVGTLKCLPEDLETGLGYLMELLTAPAFPPEEFERLRQQTLVAIQEANHDTRTVAARRLNEMLYPEGHPYHRPVIGTEESVASIALEDLQAFHRRCYGPRGGVIVVVGAVDPDRVQQAVLRACSGWAGSVGRMPIPGVPAGYGGRRHYAVEGKSQVDVAMGWALVDRNHPDQLALSCLATLLGGNGTPATSRLFRNVRERYGVSYYQFASFGAASGPAAWTVHIGVSPARVEFAVDRVCDELRRLATEPIPAEELNSLKTFLTDYPALQHESPERLAARLGEIERNNLGLDYLQRQVERIWQLSPRDLLAAARRHLDMNRLSVVSAGPALPKG